MTGRRRRLGRTLSLGPPVGEPWSWMTRTMLGSITYQSLGIHARRILDFLVSEHASHAGRENGNLAAPYAQLEAWGVTSADVRKGFAELTATGFVELTHQGLRQAGGGEPSRYALTWLPTLAGSPSQAAPSHAWKVVLAGMHRKEAGDVRATRAWLKREIAGSFGPRKKAPPTPRLEVVSPIIRAARGT